MLCSWERHLTLTVPLPTQVYKWLPANLMRWTSIPGGNRNPGRFMLRKPEISTGVMGHFARMQALRPLFISIIFMASKFETTLYITIWFSEILKVSLNRQSEFKTELKALWTPCLCSHLKKDTKSYLGILPKQGFYDSLPHDFPLRCLLTFFWCFSLSF